jgi:hypothetical protein
VTPFSTITPTAAEAEALDELRAAYGRAGWQIGRDSETLVWAALRTWDGGEHFIAELTIGALAQRLATVSKP